jgi:lipooligosaccharide transport system permease protein
VPPLAALAGFGWAGFGIAAAARAKSIDSFSYINSAILTPLFLVAGTFFPIDGLPEWVQVVAQVNPLHHLVELVRHAAFGFEGWVDVGHLGALVAFAALTWWTAVRWMERRLVD